MESRRQEEGGERRAHSHCTVSDSKSPWASAGSRQRKRERGEGRGERGEGRGERGEGRGEKGEGR